MFDEMNKVVEKFFNNPVFTKYKKEDVDYLGLTPKAQRLLKHLKKHKGGITSLQAIDKLGDTRLSATIYELRQKYCVLDEWITVTNRYGDEVKVKRYFLVE